MGIFGSVLRIGGAVGRSLLGATPAGAIAGVAVGAVAQRAGTALMRPSIQPPVPGFGAGTGIVPVPGVAGAVQRFLPGGKSGYTTSRAMTKDGRMRRIRKDGQPWSPPHMNPMNPKAARRAITRIKGARKLLRRIESSLPKRRADRPGGSKRGR